MDRTLYGLSTVGLSQTRPLTLAYPGYRENVRSLCTG